MAPRKTSKVVAKPAASPKTNVKDVVTKKSPKPSKAAPKRQNTKATKPKVEEKITPKKTTPKSTPKKATPNFKSPKKAEESTEKEVMEVEPITLETFIESLQDPATLLEVKNAIENKIVDIESKRGNGVVMTKIHFATASDERICDANLTVGPNKTKLHVMIDNTISEAKPATKKGKKSVAAQPAAESIVGVAITCEDDGIGSLFEIVRERATTKPVDAVTEINIESITKFLVKSGLITKSSSKDEEANKKVFVDVISDVIARLTSDVGYNLTECPVTLGFDADQLRQFLKI